MQQIARNFPPITAHRAHLHTFKLRHTITARRTKKGKGTFASAAQIEVIGDNPGACNNLSPLYPPFAPQYRASLSSMKSGSSPQTIPYTSVAQTCDQCIFLFHALQRIQTNMSPSGEEILVEISQTGQIDADLWNDTRQSLLQRLEEVHHHPSQNR